jgi:hypothetical protein
MKSTNHLGYDAMQSVKSLRSFEKNALPRYLLGLLFYPDDGGSTVYKQTLLFSGCFPWFVLRMFPV